MIGVRCSRKRLSVFVVAAIAVLLAAGGKSIAAERPNILLIITDQQSADVMSCRMGDQYIDTPAMDSLAAEGMLFTRAYASNPLCMPLRNSLFTGRYPHETGVTMNSPPEGGRLAPEFVFMGTYLRDAGYETAYSGKWHVCLDMKDPDAHGFEILDAKSKVAPPEDDNYDSRVARGAIDFLGRKHDKPFLLAVNLMNPHNICEWARRGAGREQRLSCGEIGTPPPSDQLPPPPANLAPPKNEPDGMTLIRRAYQVEDGKFPVGRFTPEDWRKQRWGYYRMVEKVDGEIAKILDALHKAGADENTLVIFTSDHGDCTGAHRFNQKTVFYDESVRIPLIVRWTGKTESATSEKLVNIGVDILPTILDCAGIEQPKRLPGRSILPLALGQSTKPWREYLVAQNNMSQTGMVDGIRPTMQGRMVQSERYKYCVYEHGTRREALYDTQEDPLETVNLAGKSSHRRIVVEHRNRLREFGKQHADPLVEELLANDVEPRPFTAKEDRPRPNVILIMADDVSYDHFGSYGSDYFSTPHLDKLARKGIQFNQCYSQPVCTASRVQIMTGRFNARNYVQFGQLAPSETTFGQMMRSAGYATAIAGKWQLQGSAATPGVLPADCGFQRWCMWNYPGVARNRYWQPGLNRDGQIVPVDADSYGPDICTDFLIEFIEAKRDGPFFIYYPMISVHSPFLPTPDSKDRNSKDAKENFRDMVQYMDKCVGRIVDALDKNGLREKTVILFTSDNGTARGMAYRFGTETRVGEKAYPTDGGCHAPLIVAGAGVTARAVENDDLIDFVDVMPTLAQIASAKLPDTELDGRSFWPQCQGKAGNPRSELYHYYYPKFGPAAERFGNGTPQILWTHDQRYKLYESGDLYDIVKDRLELHPLPPGDDNKQSADARQRLQNLMDRRPTDGAMLAPAHKRQVGEARATRNGEQNP